MFYSKRNDIWQWVQPTDTSMPSPFVRIEWNKFEAALLIDAYIKVSKGQAMRKDAVTELSKRLRYGMIKKGIGINAKYRNENGVTLQMSAIEFLLTDGEKGIASSNRIFTEVVEMSKVDIEAFRTLLAEAEEKYPMPTKSANSTIMLDFGEDFLGEVKVQDRLLQSEVKRVLSAKFAKGIRLNSPIDIRRFKGCYEEHIGKECNLTECDLTNVIKECGIENDGKIFVPESLLSNDLRKIIYNYIEKVFSTQRNYIFYECLFIHFKDKLLDTPVANTKILRAYLKYSYGNQFYFSKDYMSTENNVNINVDAEVVSYVREQWHMVSEEDVVLALPYLPESAVRNAFGRNQTILIAAYEGMRFHIDKFEVSEAELNKISDIIDNVIAEYQFVGGDELVKYVRQNVPTIIANNPDIPELGIRKALAVKLGDRFDFSNAVISRKGEKLSSRDVLLTFAKCHEEYTLQEIDGLAKSLGTVLNYFLETLLVYSVRINENLFVAKDKVHFDVECIDNVLYKYLDKATSCCTFRDISSFASMPDCGYSWTPRLLESYLKTASHKFTLYTSDYLNKNSVCGVIAYRSNAATFNDLIALLLVRNKVRLEKKEALEFLASEGCIVQRRYAGIEEVLKTAKSLIKNDSINKIT